MIPARSSSFCTAGIGPIPITRGSTPATAEPTNAPSGSTPSAAARSSLAITSAAAPSLIPLELPAVTVPSFAKRRLSATRASRASCPRAGARPRSSSPTGNELVGEATGRVRRGPRRCDSSANASWSSRETLHRSATFSPVSPIDSSGNISSIFGLGKRQPSVRVPDGLIAARERLLRLSHHQRRARHRLDAARDEQVAVARRSTA